MSVSATMKIAVINHHLYQEGDTYGLIYALLANQAFGVGDMTLYALFWVNLEEYKTNTDGYRDKVKRRLGYFGSFGLLGTRVHLAFCSYSDAVKVVNVQAKPHFLLVKANRTIFKNNPRRLSLLLTNAENDIGQKSDEMSLDALRGASSPEIIERAKLSLARDDADRDLELLVSESLIGHFRERFATAAAKLLIANYQKLKFRRGFELELRFDYISKSTDYVLRCVREVGFLRVTQALRNAVQTSNQAFAADNQKFLNDFVGELLSVYEGKAKKKHYAWLSEHRLKDHGDFTIVLFWIRGAKPDEKAAILGGSKDSPGKPQHHTNLVLYKLVRQLVNELAEEIERPIFFVPIGDELEEAVGDDEVYKKQSKAHNLINFFKREPFIGKPMGAQIQFLLALSSQCQVIQVGMRSGSMERLMYLGVPTIYFDRTKTGDLPSPVGAARIRQLCAFKGTTQTDLLDYMQKCIETLTEEGRSGGFPLFFQIENRDTGFLKYSAAAASEQVSNMVKKLTGDFDIEKFNAMKQALLGKNYLRAHLDKVDKGYLMMGSLEEVEVKKFALMLWFICSAYPRYAALYSSPLDLPEVGLGQSLFAKLLKEHADNKAEAEESLRQERERRRQAANAEVSPRDFFSLFDPPEENDEAGEEDDSAND